MVVVRLISTFGLGRLLLFLLFPLWFERIQYVYYLAFI